MSYCQRVSVAEYKEQNSRHFRQQMRQLLEGILDSHSMSDKEKRVKLKQVSGIIM